MQTLQNRTDIPTENTWNLASIFPSDADWERDYHIFSNRLPELEALAGTLAQSGQALFTVLQTRDELFQEVERLYVYASMHKDEDTANSMYQGMTDRAMQLYVHASTVASFIEPEILALPQEQVETFFRQAPELSLYQHQLDDLN